MVQLKDGDLVRFLVMRIANSYKELESSYKSGTYNRQDPTHFENRQIEFCIRDGVDPHRWDGVDSREQYPVSENIKIKWRDVTWGEEITIEISDNIEFDWQDGEHWEEMKKAEELPDESYHDYIERLRQEALKNKRTYTNYVYRDCFVPDNRRSENHNEFYWEDKTGSGGAGTKENMRNIILGLLNQDWYQWGWSWVDDGMGCLSDYE